jgi:Protein of unknown function (DUF3078)
MFLKIVLLSLIIISHSANLSSEEWKNSGDVGVQLSAIGFQDWEQGGENASSVVFLLKYNVSYIDSNFQWENDIDLGYGVNYSDEFNWRKNQDKIDINSKFGHKAFSDFNYAAQLNFKTQFYDGYDYGKSDSNIVSKLLSPAYLNLSIGLDYKAFESLSLFLSPVSGRLIIVADDSLSNIGAYGVEPGKMITPELGANFVGKGKWEIFTNVFFDSKLELFLNYTPQNSEQIKNIDVNWENNFLLKVNDYLSANAFIHFLYDHDVVARLQKKYFGGLGLTFKL